MFLRFSSKNPIQGVSEIMKTFQTNHKLVAATSALCRAGMDSFHEQMSHKSYIDCTAISAHSKTTGAVHYQTNIGFEKAIHQWVTLQRLIKAYRLQETNTEEARTSTDELPGPSTSTSSPSAATAQPPSKAPSPPLSVSSAEGWTPKECTHELHKMMFTKHPAALVGSAPGFAQINVLLQTEQMLKISSPLWRAHATTLALAAWRSAQKTLRCRHMREHHPEAWRDQVRLKKLLLQKYGECGAASPRY